MRWIQWVIIALVPLFVLPIPAAAYNETVPPFAVGWIYTPLASGLTVKIPMRNNTFLQPLLSVDISNSDQSTEGSYALGLRTLMGFRLTNGLYPYIGAGIGHQRSFHGSHSATTITDEERFGFQTFFGLELQKNFIHPAIEIGIMGLQRSDNSLHFGTSINFGAYLYL